MLILLPLLGVLFNGLTTVHVEANLSLEFKATKLLRQHNPANCTVGNKTYAHGQTFKLDCKTQCVCENGRHACSSLCPKEQLPAPEDTISCRSPRLVEVPGHCCKMWLCENPTADVYATCHNASTSPWTPCSQPCGLGTSTRFTSTNTGCRQLSSLRLCENRKCDQDNNNNTNSKNRSYSEQQQAQIAQKANAPQQKHAHQRRQQQLISHNAAASNLVVRGPKDIKDITNYHALYEHEEHRIRKGHECRSLQRLGPARIRLGACISRKLYRPKLCGRCHQRSSKCCTPSLSTTIQVELLCPLNAADPINFAEQHRQPEGQPPPQLWDTLSLEPIDQEFLQSHQIQIENKFIAVEWILKCECDKNENCNSQRKYTTTMQNSTSNSSINGQNITQKNNNISNSNSNSSWHTSGIVDDHNNSENAATNINSGTAHNYNENAYNNNGDLKTVGSGNNNADTTNSDSNSHRYNEQNSATDNGGDNRNEQQQLNEVGPVEPTYEEQQQYLVSSGELQLDIIPYPVLLERHRSSRQQEQEQGESKQANGDMKNNENNNSNANRDYDNRYGNEVGSNAAELRGSGGGGGGMRANPEHVNSSVNIKRVGSVAAPNKNIVVADFGFYDRDGDDNDANDGAGHKSDEQLQQNTLEEDAAQQQQKLRHSQQQEWEVEKNLHYQRQKPEPFSAWQKYYPHQQEQQQHQQHQHSHHQHHHHHHHHQHLGIHNHHQQQHHLHQRYQQHQQHSHPHPHPPQSPHHLLEQVKQEQESPNEQQHALPQRRT